MTCALLHAQLAAEKGNQHVGGMRLALMQKNHGKQSGNLEACAPLVAELVAMREEDMSLAAPRSTRTILLLPPATSLRRAA